MIDFDAIEQIWEIGPGYGGQTEVILKLHPHLRYVGIDIPPMAYLTEQYLKAVFLGEVLGYEESRDWGRIKPEHITGKRISVLWPWLLPKL